MRHHQKYFSVEDADGKLAPQFVAVMNTVAIPKAWSAAATSACCAPASTTRASSGRPIRRRSSPTACEDLAHVTFQAKLGSYLEKTERIVALVTRTRRRRLRRSARRSCSKCDLTTELVKEFTELQGVVGGLYARAQGEPEAGLAGDLRSLQAGSMEDSIPRNRTGADRVASPTSSIRCAAASASA